MPVEILNSQQRAAYGRFNNDPSPEQLTKYCYLTDGDVAFIRKRRPEPYQQLGFALQLMTVRFLGTFLDDPLDVPERLNAFGAARLGIEGEQGLSQYMASKELRFDHRKIICREFGYKTFEDPIEQWSLMRWVYARSWFSTEKPLALFDLATTRLVDRNVLLPGATTCRAAISLLRAWMVSDPHPHDLTALPNGCAHLVQLHVSQMQPAQQSLMQRLGVHPSAGQPGLDRELAVSKDTRCHHHPDALSQCRHHHGDAD